MSNDDINKWINCYQHNDIEKIGEEYFSCLCKTVR